jgi:UDP-N-acetylmuramate dehydrogenase
VKRDISSQVSARVRGEVLCHEPLALHTSLKVGGPADCFVVPADLDDLRELLLLCAEKDAAHLLIGGGYNLLVRDGGFRGVAISLRNFRGIARAAGNVVSVGPGVTTGELVRYAEERRLAGLEFLIGIPGTVGGALSMNAGAHGEAILDRLTSMTTLSGGELRTRQREELTFGYRYLRLLPGEVIVEAGFQLHEGEPVEIEERLERFLAHRRNAQRVGYPNAGSFFKNPAGQQAWRLVDGAGLRGCRIGGAQVAEAHANFLVNRGGATAGDFIELATLVKEKVEAASGILLEEEVRIVGND